MLVKSNIQCDSKDKKKRILTLCYKNDIVNVIADHGNVLIVFKNEPFPIRVDEIESIDMTKEKLLESVKLTINRIKTPEQFPYDFLFSILDGKLWVQEFMEMVKNSDIDEQIKRKINEINSQVQD